ncbi:MAG: hypothetical protein DMF59_12070 [Acidobacteria bacterium]|nr:MAG: hypothetical protein DMF59_12070 [Acidobacteriota bacterium]
MKKYWIAILLLSTGCATVLKRPGEPIAVDSKPAGADAVIQCAGAVRASGVTPTRITIPRASNGCVLSISKQGYATKVVPLERGYNSAYWSNFALLPGITLALFLDAPRSNEDRVARAAAAATGLSGVFGFVVDRNNGHGYRHFPDEINETLEPIK